MRCMITASLRTTATTARLWPRLPATRRPHDFNVQLVTEPTLSGNGAVGHADRMARMVAWPATADSTPPCEAVSDSRRFRDPDREKSTRDV